MEYKSFSPSNYQWSLPFIETIRFDYQCLHTLNHNRQHYEETLQKDFCLCAIDKILLELRKDDNAGSVVEFLTIKLHKKNPQTIVEQIANSTYRCLIKKNESKATIVITESDMEKMKTSQERVVEGLKKVSLLFRGVFLIIVTKQQCKIFLEIHSLS
jgi:hypothetical protein